MHEGRQSQVHESRPSHVGTESGWTDLRRTVAELIRVFLLRKWAFFVPFCLTATAALLFSHHIPRMYRATTVFERRSDLATMKLAREGSPQKFRSILRSFGFDIVDSDAMCEVVDNLGWTDDFPRDEQGNLTQEGEKARLALANSYKGGISWEFFDRSDELDLIELSYTVDEPEIARQLLEEIRDTYIRRTQKRILGILEDARTYFQKKLDENQARADLLAEKLLRFQIEHPGIDPGNPGTIAQKIALLESQRESLERRKWELEADVSAREAFLTGQSAWAVPSTRGQDTDSGEQELIPNPRRAELERRIRRIESEIADLQLTRYMTDRHPKIATLRRAMQAAAEKLTAEPERVPRDTAIALAGRSLGPDAGRSDVAADVWQAQRARVEMEVSSLRVAEARIEQDQEAVSQQIASFQKMRETIFDKRRDYARLEEEAASAREETVRWRSRLEEIDGILDVESHQQGMGFSVVVPAARVTRPVSPRFWTVIALSLMLGFGVGIAVVLVLELLDRKIRTASQVVRATGLPILDAVGEIVTAAERRARFIRSAVLKPALVAALVLMTGGSAMAAYASIENPRLLEHWKTKPVLNWIAGTGGQAQNGIT